MPIESWMRRLAEPVHVGRRELKTLADVRAHLSTLSVSSRIKPSWQKVSDALHRAACGGDTREVTRTVEAARAVEDDGNNFSGAQHPFISNEVPS